MPTNVYDLNYCTQNTILMVDLIYEACNGASERRLIQVHARYDQYPSMAK